MEGSGPGQIEHIKEGDTDCCHLAMRMRSLEEAVSVLKLIGVELEEPKVGPDFRAAFLKQPDPTGNRVHLLR